MNITDIRFDENGLVPAIVQDYVSKEVLTLAYMNEQSFRKSIETKETWFYSRSRQELWHKGETSGNAQKIVEIRFDCDQDALIVFVEPKGPACHTGSYSCFSKGLRLDGDYGVDEVVKDGKGEGENKRQEKQERQDPFQIIRQLEVVIAKREAERPEGSYTSYLFDEGVDKILKKVGEEAAEVIIAAKNQSKEELTWESADLLYHLLVLLREQKLPLNNVLQRLEERHLEKGKNK